MIDLAFPEFFLLQGEDECGKLRSRAQCLLGRKHTLKALHGAIDHGQGGGV